MKTATKYVIGIILVCAMQFAKAQENQANGSRKTRIKY